MAKGGYMCICYPEDLERKHINIDYLVQSIVNDGGAVAYILHDKDGVKPHYHFTAMWSRSPKPWLSTPKRKGFKMWMIEHCCIAPHTFDNGSYTKWHYETCLVRDIDAVLNYMLHG